MDKHKMKMNAQDTKTGMRGLSRENELAILDWVRRHRRFAPQGGLRD